MVMNNAAPSLQPRTDQIAALRDLDWAGPIVMLNLLRFQPGGGAAEYAAYGDAARPYLDRAGAKVRYLGRVAATVIGGEPWDEVILVEYPSKQAFLEMIADPGYREAARHRTAALADSRLYCTLAGRSS
jgi:uncharacterized protein (DUF1330 family)